MSLRLRRLRLVAQTDEGPYGVDIPFTDGLVLLRAHNSRGKSTCIQAVVYALGLEAMLTMRHDVPLPHAMTDRLTSADGDLKVRESWVTLEVENGEGRHLTVQRWARSDEYDTNLIRTWDGMALSNPDDGGRQRDTYARLRGAARSGAGFLNVLEGFLGWHLPILTRADSTPAKLYPEMVFPLFFVEQKRGWSAIQAQMPPYAGMPEPRQRAIEFTLALDFYERSRKRRELQEQIDQLAGDWKRLVGEFRARLDGTGVRVQGLPDAPQRTWPADVPPTLLAGETEGWRSLSQEKAVLEERSAELTAAPTPSSDEAATAARAKLTSAQEGLARMFDAATHLEHEARDDRAQIEALLRRLEAIDEDILQSSDAATLTKLGGEHELAVLNGDCPTCHQQVGASLLASTDGPAMTAQENVRYLREQRGTFEAMIKEAQGSVAAKSARIDALRERMGAAQDDIRSLRATLTAPGDAPSEAVIAEKIHVRERLDRYSRIEQSLSGLNVDLEALSESYASARRELDDLPADSLSDADRFKLSALQDHLVEQLAAYGLNSLRPDEISISNEKYVPSREGYDLGFDLSASDNIRIIWAYLLSLLELGAETPTNHPGLLMFDEPRQQDADRVSMAALIQRAAQSAARGQQVVFATSEPRESLERMVVGLDSKLLDFGDDFILKPLS
jgi:hypothetical protein